MKPEELVKKLKLLREAFPGSEWFEHMSDYGLSPVIVLSAKDHVRPKRLIDWMERRFFPANDCPKGFYFGAELGSAKSTENIVTSLRNASLFSKNELLLIYNADKMKVQAAKVIHTAARKSAARVLLLALVGSIKKKGGFWSDLPHVTADFVELKGAALRRWIEREVKRSGASGIEEKALERLMHSYGSDLDNLSWEIRKLSLLCEADCAITSQSVEALCSKNPELTSFKILDEVSAHRPLRAVAATRMILEQGFHPLQLSSFLSRCFRVMLCDKGKDGCAFPIPSELTNAWFLRNTSRAKGTMGIEDMKNAIEILRGLDWELKSSRLDSELLTLLAVQKMAIGKGTGSV